MADGMVKTKLGRVVPKLRGEYSASTAYAHLDIVRYQRNSFIALVDSLGVLPTDTATWMQMTDVERGAAAYVWIRYADQQPTSDADIKDTPGDWLGVYSGTSETPPTAFTAYTWQLIVAGGEGAGDMRASDYADEAATKSVKNARELGGVAAEEYLQKDGDASATTATFTQASAAPANITSGETLQAIFGKIRKWFASFGAAAWAEIGAGAGQVAAGSHASQHAEDGADPVTPEAISAARAVDTMPAATVLTYGQVALYTGSTTADYTKGVVYRCIQRGGAYLWEAAAIGDGIVAAQIANRIYPGVDLTIRFADEIAGFGGDPWAWIKARIGAVDYHGINIGDYIRFTCTNGYVIKAEVAGIDTYYRYGNTEVPHHIDFITRDCWPDSHAYNKVNYNNGTTVSPSPWLASDLYAWLNSLAMSVPNAGTANPALVSVNYAATGVYDKLPVALKAVIVPKRAKLPIRFTSGSLLTSDNNVTWADAGKLWIPSEVEVYGMEHFGSRNGFSSTGYQQYPLFAQNMRRIKGAGDGGAPSVWWLSSPNGSSSASCTRVAGDGSGLGAAASDSTVRVAFGFRITG